MALVPITHVYDTKAVIDATELLNGQILYTTDQLLNKIYADVLVNGTLTRIEIGGTNTVDTVLDQSSGHAIANSAVAKLAQTVHTNLLNPTLGTTTVNGVTCTANGDGTYTLNGTATSDGLFVIRTAIDTLELPKTYRLVGCPSGGSGSTFELNTVKIVGTSRSVFAIDRGNGATIEYVSGATYEVRIRIANGAVLDNVVFKPMLTTDLSATYDDFVQYSGDGELNENVVSLFNDVETLNTDSQKTKASLAPVESGTTASQAYTVGSLLVYQGRLCKATSAIAQGNTLTIGTNIAYDTVASEINQINSNLSDSKNWKSYGTAGITQVSELMTGVDNRITIPKTASELVIIGTQWSATIPLITGINRNISFYYGGNYLCNGFINIDAQYIGSVNKDVVFSICCTQIGAMDTITRGYITGIYYR